MNATPRLKLLSRHFGKNDMDVARLAGQARMGEFVTGWLGMVGRAGKSWPETDAEFNIVHLWLFTFP